jgi:two-component system, NtrC family, response regulator
MGAQEQVSILLVEDDPGLRMQMKWALAPYNVIAAGTGSEALGRFKAEGAVPVVVLDLGLPPDENGVTEGLKTLQEILVFAPRTKVIVASGRADRASAMQAVAKGAFDFFEKPVDVDVLKLTIERALRMCALESENDRLRESTTGRSGLVFACSKMAQVERMLERLGPSDVSVLIFGETGTGKEVVARALHERSMRRTAPFVAINCASIPENLLESEFFGHERGAFTGAVKQTIGKVELANTGTLFLDEIGDMPFALQAKLLRFIQERQFERVGGRASINVDVRLICATNRPLEKMVADNRFREDLYYRINEICIQLPPLRERESDVILLAQHFLDAITRTSYRKLRGISDEALSAISAHSWPGNVRELENRMKRAVIMAEGKFITPSDLGFVAAVDNSIGLNLRSEVRKLEQSLVQRALAIAEGNVSRAAKLLQVSRPHLYNLMRELDPEITEHNVGD